jgi:hypothetical protein
MDRHGFDPIFLRAQGIEVRVKDPLITSQKTEKLTACP